MIALVPAYGRTYESMKEAQTDWEAGKDFKIYGGPYCSIRDKELMEEEYSYILIYWDITRPDGPNFVA